MTKKSTSGNPKPAAGPRIYEATRAGDGKVVRGREITLVQAVARRKIGLDVVVCGGVIEANRNLAQSIESQIGPWERQAPHRESAGVYALPHFQQRSRSPEGHSFYETAHKKAAIHP